MNPVFFVLLRGDIKGHLTVTHQMNNTKLMRNCRISIIWVIMVAMGVVELKTHENLVEELARLSPEELKIVLASLGKRLENDNQLKMAEEIIKEYKPALEELAK